MQPLGFILAISSLALPTSVFSVEPSSDSSGQMTKQNAGWNAFHDQVVKNAPSEAAISPDLITTSNPHVKPYAAFINAAKWNTQNIPVCWENPSAADAEAMQWVRDATFKTWEKYSALKFTGWQACEKLNNGIRIQIADDGPHVKRLGQQLNGLKNGMVLNFTFRNWSPSCRKNRESCIRSIAVHEFGHAIGLTHEQNRPDSPGECIPLAQGTAPDRLLTPYDAASVMNYCNKKWNNDGFLSKLDIDGIQTIYGKPQP